jgi:hypothetical protein
MENLVADTIAQTNLSAISEVVKQEVVFTYNLQTYLALDSWPVASLSLQIPGPNGTQFAYVVSQIAPGPLEFTQINIPSRDIVKYSSPITETFHLLRPHGISPEIVYTLTQKPIKLFKVDITNEITDLIGEIFPGSTLPLASKVLAKVSNYAGQNILCGSLGNSIFYKDEFDVITYFNSTQPIKNLSCLKFGNVLVENNSGEFYLSGVNGESKIFANADYACLSSVAGTYQSGMNIICYYKNASGVQVTKQYLINEASGVLTEQSKLVALTSTVLPFNLFFDIVNTDYHSPGTALIRYYQKSAPSLGYQELPIEVLANPRNIFNMRVESNSIILDTNYSFYKLDPQNNEMTKYPTSLHPRLIGEWNGENYLIYNSGNVHKFDPSRVTNDYFYSYQPLTKATLNPTLYQQSPDKVPDVYRPNFKDGFAFYTSFLTTTVGTTPVATWKIYRRNLQTGELIIQAMQPGEVMQDLRVDDSRVAFVIKKTDGKIYLMIYDLDLNYQNQVLLSANSTYDVSIVRDGYIARNLLGDVIKYDLELNKKWTTSWSGLASTRFLHLPSGDYLGISHGWLSLFKNSNGSVKQLYNLNSAGMGTIIYDLALVEDKLYMNFRGTALKSINLPFEIVYLPSATTSGASSTLASNSTAPAAPSNSNSTPVNAASPSSESTSTQATTSTSLSNLVNAAVTTTNLATIVRIIEEEDNFSYNLQEKLITEPAPLGRVALTAPAPNLSQYIFLGTQRTGLGVEFTKVELPSKQVTKFASFITEPIHFLRTQQIDPDIFYAITQKPIKLYKVNVANQTAESLGELLSGSSLPLASRVLAKSSFYTGQNILCGSLGNTIFYKDEFDVVTYSNTTQPIKNIYCLQFGNVLVENNNGEFYLTGVSGENKIFANADNGCTSSVVGVYQSGANIICYYKNASGVQAYKPYLLDQATGGVTQQTSVATLTTNVLPFTAVWDPVNLAINKSSLGILRYYSKTLGWQEVDVPIDTAPRKISRLIKDNNQFNFISSYHALYTADTSNLDIINKFPTGINTRGMWSWNNQNYIVDAAGKIYRYDSTRTTNDYSYVNQPVSKGALNPVLSQNFSEVIGDPGFEVHQVNGYVYFASKVGTSWKIYRRSLETGTTDSISLAPLETIYDFQINDSGAAIIYQKADKTNHLVRYDNALQEISRVELMGYNVIASKISLVNDGVIIRDASKLVKFDLALNLQWQTPVSGLSTSRFLQLPSGHYLGVNHGWLSLVNRNTGVINQLFNVQQSGITSVFNLVLDDTKLYFLARADALKILNLPAAAVYLQ